MPLLCASGSLTAKAFGFTSGYPFGEVVYTSSNDATFTFVVPIGVTKISIVAIGAGGGGAQICDWSNRSQIGTIVYTTGSASASIKTGGGGALAYVNDISVTPGESLTVNVGGTAPGGSIFATNYGNGYGYGKNGSPSSVYRGATPLVAAGGGKADGTGAGGVVIVGTGYAGGNGGEHWAHTNEVLSGGGGGGAGGYTAVGGNGGNAGQQLNPTASTGGGGGGGGAGDDFYFSIPLGNVDIGSAGAGGGGVGLYGLGSNGAAGVNAIGGSFEPNQSDVATGGGGGSGGNTGQNPGDGTRAHVPGQGGSYGGGGGMGGTRLSYYVPQYVGATGAASNQGAVRIIWSTVSSVPRQFPSTNVGVL